MRTGIIILAAGGSSRLGNPKQLVNYRGQTLIRRAAHVAVESVCDTVVAVIGSNAQQIRSELHGLPLSIVENRNWQSGMSSSIRLGLEGVESRHNEIYGVVVMLCDQPFVTASVLNRLIVTHRQTNKLIVASVYGETRGAPAFFRRDLFPELKSLTGDEGARRIIVKHPESVALITFARGAIDIDTPEDLQRLEPDPRVLL